MPPVHLSAPARRLAPLLLLVLALSLAPLAASDTPPPPASPLSGLVKKLTEKRTAPSVAKPTKEQLLRPEFRFRAAPGWLLLPDLARQLTTNETEREAILNLMDVGAREARKLLAAEAEGADRDVAAATSLFVSQLWGIVRQTELTEEAGDALHAQIVGALAGPEVARMSDADKQKYWEFCLGFPVFVLGMREVATDPSAQEDLRKIAAAGFESLIGVNPNLVDLGPQGMVVRAGLEAAARKVKENEAAAAANSAPAPVTVVRAPGAARETAGNVDPRLIGKWNRSSSVHPEHGNLASWGAAGYTKSRYEFNGDGTYLFTQRTFGMLHPEILIVKERGTFAMSGNQLTVVPQTGVIESYSKKNKVDELGDRIKSQPRPLETVTYTSTLHFFSGIQEWNLVLQASQPTRRDGSFSTNTTFTNAWYFDQKFIRTDLTSPTGR